MKITDAQWENVTDVLGDIAESVGLWSDLRGLLDVMVTRAHDGAYDAGESSMLADFNVALDEWDPPDTDADWYPTAVADMVRRLERERDELATEVLRLVGQDVRRRHDAQRAFKLPVTGMLMIPGEDSSPGPIIC